MATVTGFEGLRHPRRSDLRQFSELFEPLFSASSDEARRQAAAALSQCPHVPQSVALVIGMAPLPTAAIFLTRSTAITDATLLQIIRSQGPGHATAIARRDNLSVTVVDALVERRQTAAPAKATALPQQTRREETPSPESNAAKLQREEKLRSDIKTLARAGTPAAPAVGIGPVEPLHEALLVRFARSGEANLFAAGLSATLSCSLALAERILLDISGQHLATALTALSMQSDDMLFILNRLYPDLAERFGGSTRGEILLASTNLQDSRNRVLSWLRAETEDRTDAGHHPYLGPDRMADPRQSPIREDKHRRSDTAAQQPVFARRR
ncbi:DUF2336 domain-containing protein [Pararhizobium gei]|uniref:DUF2336 domain-containing protein n=1 Tax=Pararhizobium gei TaxID=1395951 RepID=UPI0023D9A2C4|nr:DUF2336 domain-containing protein [Rhizobium gei]